MYTMLRNPVCLCLKSRPVRYRDVGPVVRVDLLCLLLHQHLSPGDKVSAVDDEYRRRHQHSFHLFATLSLKTSQLNDAVVDERPPYDCLVDGVPKSLLVRLAQLLRPLLLRIHYLRQSYKAAPRESMNLIVGGEREADV